jgi:hypothetical protein
MAGKWLENENTMQVHISLCPECLSTARPPVAETLNPLKISNTIRKWAQMNLIVTDGMPVWDTVGYYS